MMPPDDEVPASTTAGSMTGSAMPPAKAVVAATDRAAARAIFFIGTSKLKQSLIGFRSVYPEPSRPLRPPSNALLGAKTTNSCHESEIRHTKDRKFRQFGNSPCGEPGRACCGMTNATPVAPSLRKRDSQAADGTHDEYPAPQATGRPSVVCCSNPLGRARWLWSGLTALWHIGRARRAQMRSPFGISCKRRGFPT